MNAKYTFVVAAMAVMLIGATAFAADNAFAGGDKKKSGKSQATSQANYCGNGKMPMYVFCQNTGSQIQGEDNVVKLDSDQKRGDNHKDKKDWDHDGGHNGGGDGPD
jgi:hypothetical protein